MVFPLWASLVLRWEASTLDDGAGQELGVGQGGPGDGHVGWRVPIRVNEPQRPPGPGLWQRLAAQFSWGGRAGGLCGLCPVPSGDVYMTRGSRGWESGTECSLLASDSDSMGRGSYV